MKNPAVIHLKCLDTMALQGVARSFGSGAAGVRLTPEGLEAHVRPSRRASARRERPSEPPPARDVPPAREDRADTLAPQVSVMLPPPSGPRASMPSLVTIEMGLRKPTTWAVVLLTLGVSFGVVIARVATDAAMPAPHAVRAAAAPTSPVELVAAPRAIRKEPAPAELPPSSVTIATTTIVARRHAHTHGVTSVAGEVGGAALSTDVASGPVAASEQAAPNEKRGANEASEKKDAAEEKSDTGDESTAAAAASEQVRRELSDSL